MDRRASIKSLMIGTLAGGVLLESCLTNSTPEAVQEALNKFNYGKQDYEIERDLKLLEETFFNAHEMHTLTVLADRILPPNDHGSIAEAEVPELIEFMAKDVPDFQVPLRGGLMRLDADALENFGKKFVDCEPSQQHTLMDQMAYPLEGVSASEQPQNIQFFALVRNLTMTGYYTSKVGIAELGYQGNRPNVWNGVPDDVLDAMGLSYEEEWLEKCIDQSTRNTPAAWDEQGNLLT